MLEADAGHDSIATRMPARPSRTREVYVDGIGAVPLKDLMSPSEVAYWTGHSETWLRRDRRKQCPSIPYIECGRRAYYLPSDVLEAARPAYVGGHHRTTAGRPAHEAAP